jgi:hypothetical protein
LCGTKWDLRWVLNSVNRLSVRAAFRTSTSRESLPNTRSPGFARVDGVLPAGHRAQRQFRQHRDVDQAGIVALDQHCG